MATTDLRIAVFIDFDNIEIGVKNTLGAAFDAGLVLEALKERGEVVSKMAYSDWQRAGGYSRALTQHAIRMVQRNLTPGGDKNGADINLALDALEMAFTHPHINAFVIVGGDSDFISLVEKLKQYDKKVFVVGGTQFTSAIMQRNCHEFIAYENLIGGGPRRQSGGRSGKGGRAEISEVLPLVRRAMKVLLERDADPQLGLFKSTLLQLDSTFSERTYGAGTFRDFAQKLEKAGVLRVHQGKGAWLVAPGEGLNLGAGGTEADAAAPGEPGRQKPNGQDEKRPEAAGPAAAEPAEPIKVIGTPADGIREAARIIAAAEVRKWPLYLRTVKQILRAQTPPFDERAYGFPSLVELLRASHKEGALRVERDRQGVIRVFQSGSAGLPASASPETSRPEPDSEPAAADTVESVDAAVAPPEAPAAAAAADDSGEGKAPKEPKVKAKRTRAPRKPRARTTTTAAPSSKKAKATKKAKP